METFTLHRGGTILDTNQWIPSSLKTCLPNEHKCEFPRETAGALDQFNSRAKCAGGCVNKLIFNGGELVAARLLDVPESAPGWKSRSLHCEIAGPSYYSANAVRQLAN